jgi:hypothetical protein
MPESPPLPSPEALLAWLRDAAGRRSFFAQVLLHPLERVEVLEAAQQQPHQDKLDRLIALDRGDDAPTPEAAPVARPEGDWFAVAMMAQDMRSRGLAEQEQGNELLRLAHAQPPAPQPAPPAAPAGGLAKKVAPYCGGMGDARSVIRLVAAWLDQQGQHGCSLLLREEADQ